MGTAAQIISVLPGIGSEILFANGYRPWQWALGAPQSVSLVANAIQTATTETTATTTLPENSGTETQVFSNSEQYLVQNTYYFDAVLREDHLLVARPTRHPIQNGAVLSDHVILEPARIVLEILMSDAMDSYVTGQYSGSSTKSVNAYAVFSSLQQQRIPLTLNTRLFSYPNLVLEEIRAHQDVATYRALKATLVFQQVFLGSVAKTTLSARPNASVQTSPGASSVQPVPANLQSLQNSSGQWSSNNLGIVSP